jgi:predicted hydrolase (HD superfamily)
VSNRLGLAEAEGLVGKWLGDTPRAAHSRFVGEVMRRLALELGGDVELWQVVGLVHDLDYFAVAGDWSRHGRLTADWLAGQLPAEAHDAIAAHDHRSGTVSDTVLSDMLKLADALAVLDESAGRELTCGALSGGGLADVVGNRPYLATMIKHLAGHHHLALERLAQLLEGLPRQSRGR